jgi:hypothetical protein
MVFSLSGTKIKSPSWNINFLFNIQNGLLSTDTTSYSKGSYEIIGKSVPDGELSRASSIICCSTSNLEK